MIQSLGCHNFRNIDVDRLSFKRINILIGPNNAGKTNLLRALSFCSDMLKRESGSAPSAFLNEVSHNGWHKMLNRAAGNDGIIKFRWDLSIRGKNLGYDFQFHTGRQQADFYITSEKLDTDSQGNYARPYNHFDCHTEQLGKGVISTAKEKGVQNRRIYFDVSNQDTVMTQFPKILLKYGELYNTPSFRKDGMSIVEELMAYFRKFFSYSSAYLDLATIRRPSDSRIRGDILYGNGSNFVNVLNERFGINIYLRQEMEDRLRSLIPSLDHVNIASQPDQYKFQLGMHGKTYDMDEVSDGTIKAILLVFLLFGSPEGAAPSQPEFSLLTLDEPENNLHPAWQKWIARWIMESTNYEQCFVCTHSPDFLDGFTDGFIRGDVAVLVADPRKGQLFTNLAYDDVKEDLDGWQLGDLYRVNEPSVGGWPW